MNYKSLSATHPEYDADYWAEIKALANGGKELLRTKVLSCLLPKMPDESQFNYSARLAKAFCIPHLGVGVGRFIQGVASDPIHVEADRETDAYYDELEANIAPRGRTEGLNHLLQALLRSALLYKRSYALVDFPAAAARNAAEEKRLGLGRAYAVEVDAASVLDWEQDDAGAFTWALVRNVTSRRLSVAQSRDQVEESFTVYTATDWTRYTYRYQVDKKPAPDAAPDEVTEGPHSFGRVPLIRMEMPDELWAGNLAFSLAKEIFAKENALSFSGDNSLFPQWVAFLAPQDMAQLDPNKENENRAVTQVFGPGRMITLAKDDRLESITQDTAGHEQASSRLEDYQCQLNSLLNQMGLSAPQTSAALGRSAESKAADLVGFAATLRMLGAVLRQMAVDLFQTIDTARKGSLVFEATGGESFDGVDPVAAVEEALSLEALNMPPAFQVAYKYTLAKRLLPEATEDDLKAIRAGLERSNPSEG